MNFITSIFAKEQKFWCLEKFVQADKLKMIQRMSNGNLNKNMAFCIILKLRKVDKYKDSLKKNHDFIYIITIIDSNKFNIWLGIRIILEHC